MKGKCLGRLERCKLEESIIEIVTWLALRCREKLYSVLCTYFNKVMYSFIEPFLLFQVLTHYF